MVAFDKSLEERPINPKNRETLRLAARDLAYLLDRGYPERASLKLVGDRFGLKGEERELLLRATVPRPKALSRRQKRVRARDLRGVRVSVDGFNVLATLAHALRGAPLVLARDGFVRDGVRAGRNLRLEPEFPFLLDLLNKFFVRFRPGYLGFYLDAPISGSGKLAARLRLWLREQDLPGEALALKDAERRVLSGEVVCTADGPLLDRAERTFDLAGFILRVYLRKPVFKLFG